MNQGCAVQGNVSIALDAKSVSAWQENKRTVPVAKSEARSLEWVAAWRTAMGVLLLCFGSYAHAEVRVFIQNSNSLALVNYECTAGETVRAFALDISADRGVISAISDFVRGPSTETAPGYGIFPASLRDHLAVSGSTNLDWNSPAYTPLAAPSDAPLDTLTGLNSKGVTLELGALWPANDPAAAPGPAGTLCVLTLSQPANVSVAPNQTRGGVVSAFPQGNFSATFSGALVGPGILSAILDHGNMTVRFQGGELQKATSVAGPWSDTGDSTGVYLEVDPTNQPRFYRVRSP